MNKEDRLFQEGIKAFNNRCFYDAHEYWEDLWLNYKITDAKFIQGLIQLSVSYFHLFNDNINGARSMIKKCQGKFKGYSKNRGIDVVDLIKQLIKVQVHLNNINNKSEILDSYILTLKDIHE